MVLNDMEYEIVNPSPSSLVESNRAFGYSPETSIADLLDNSITAGARNIWIDFDWNGRNSSIFILDDGNGMTAEELTNAMRLGSKNPLNERDEKDLGRFGLGLKTASFAQCRSLTVASLTSDGVQNTRIWDLDVVSETDEWRLLSNPSPENVDLICRKLTNNLTSGTLVVWNNLDRMVGDTDISDEIASRNFLSEADKVGKHLSMVFHRYMVGRNKINIYLGKDPKPLTPWDPFISDSTFTQTMEEDSPTLFGKHITIVPYVLPHHTEISQEVHHLASGIKGWNAHQGFYVYRNRRLLVAGSWLGISNLKQEEHYKLARIRVDIPNSMDNAWELDVKKSEARPPAGLRRELNRIATNTRKRAQEVYRYRGKPVARKHADEFVYVWNKHSLRGGKSRYSINRKHPLIQSLKDKLNGNHRPLESALKLIEETLPISLISVESLENPEGHIQYFEGKSGSEIYKVMEDALEALIQSEVTLDEAFMKISTMEPFERYPEQLALIAEKYEVVHG